MIIKLNALAGQIKAGDAVAVTPDGTLRLAEVGDCVVGVAISPTEIRMSGGVFQNNVAIDDAFTDRQIMTFLEKSRGEWFDANTIATTLGLNVTTTRYNLKQLVEGKQVEQERLRKRTLKTNAMYRFRVKPRRKVVTAWLDFVESD